MNPGTTDVNVRGYIEHWLRVDGRTKPQVYAQVFESAGIASLNYWLELIIAAGIATFGLVQNSPAVIIGAMLISPLMGPIMATVLALAAGDLYLGIRSVVTLGASIAASVALSAGLVWILPFHSVTGEILARTNPNLLDLGVALLSGLAGSLVVSRGGTGGGMMALPGVAIAVALMPPLCTAGFGIGAGWNGTVVSGAVLLFLTNLAAIVTSAFVVFFAVRMDAPAVRGEIDRYIQEHAREGVLSSALLTLQGGSPWQIGKLHWRVLMLAITLAAVFFPLRNALSQMAHEAVARNSVQDHLRRLAPADTLVSQQVRVSADRIGIRLISTERIPAERIREARASMERRTGKRVDLSISEVASKSELAEVLDRMAAPAPPPPPARPLGETGAELLERVKAPLHEIWPASSKMAGYQLEFAAPGTVLRIRYESRDDFPPAVHEMLQAALRSRLDAPELTVALERINPAEAKPGRRR